MSIAAGLTGGSPSPPKRRLHLFPRQDRFVQDQRPRPGYIGGLGSGKSYAGAAKVLSRLDAKERGMIVAPTYDMLRTASLQTVLDLLALVRMPYAYNKNEREFTFHNGHTITCRSAERYDTMRGPNLDYAWVDEAALIAEEAWQIVKGRVRVGRNPQTWITSTPKGRNWIWAEWERDAAGTESDPTHPLYRVTTQENPTLPPDFAASLGYVGRFAEQELGGRFVAFEGLVYPQFNRPIHVRETDTDGWRTVLGVDVGTRNPTAILTIHAASDERRHVSRELYRRQMSSDDIVAAVAEQARLADAETVYLDPSASGYIKSLAERGVPAVKADHDLATGIPTVMTALAEGFTIDPACVNTIAEFESYRYPENRREADKPIPQGNHAMDALRYGLMGLHDGPALLETDYFGETQTNEWDAGGEFAAAFHGWI